MCTLSLYNKIVSSISFSTGITWFYWAWYKNRDNIPAIIPSNINDYGGYDIKKIFVEKKYENYKQEILQNMVFRKAKLPTLKTIISTIFCQAFYRNFQQIINLEF